jgi:hypothetical protein
LPVRARLSLILGLRIVGFHSTIRFFMMMTKIIFIVLLLSINGFGQQVFNIKKASKLYDVRLEVKCEEDSCAGDAKFSVFRKDEKKPVQVFKTYTEFNALETQISNAKRMYDYQSVVYFEDYNFDGIEDLSIRDGNNSGYGGPSYQIFLFSPKLNKFVHNEALTELNQSEYLGSMTVDKKKQVLRVFSKGGCCLHTTKEFKVVGGNRLKKVYEMEENAMIADEKKVMITTSRLVNGKWKTKVHYIKREE